MTEPGKPATDKPEATGPQRNRRVVFFLSDQTGVTAETLGRSLLTQFEGYDFDQVTVPFIDSVDKADEAVHRINAFAAESGTRPIIFSTLVHDEIRERFTRVNGLLLDFFSTFLGQMEQELLPFITQ
jgi:regulator of PEP synthase PpsR (kinase-PPPase family)